MLPACPPFDDGVCPFDQACDVGDSRALVIVGVPDPVGENDGRYAEVRGQFMPVECRGIGDAVVNVGE